MTACREPGLRRKVHILTGSESELRHFLSRDGCVLLSKSLGPCFLTHDTGSLIGSMY